MSFQPVLEPLRSTPPVNLTQDLPPEHHADILLLECGDARNILFTTYMDPGRPLDVTCSDEDPVIIARNILLCTLLLDDKEAKESESIWNIYHHRYLDDCSLNLLEQQALKLLSLSRNFEDWIRSPYGPKLQFCDKKTFEQATGLWLGYTSRHLSWEEKVKREKQYRRCIDREEVGRIEVNVEPITTSSIRSAAPIGTEVSNYFSTIHEHFWDCGTVDHSDQDNSVNAHQHPHPNPTFTSISSLPPMLYRGVDPLLGYPLATAFAPLTSNSPLCPQRQPVSPTRAIVDTAQLQFREWSKSFRQSCSHGTILRFFIGNAIVFNNALQRAGAAGANNHANLYCNCGTFEPLKLEDGHFDRLIKTAPRRFDIIDTSTLICDAGAVQVLVAAVPLLKESPASTLYAEVHANRGQKVRGVVNAILGHHFSTVSLLLGIASVQQWTNATAVADVDEWLFDDISGQVKAEIDNGKTRFHTRLCWKLVSSYSRLQFPSRNVSHPASRSLEMDARGLSSILHEMHQHVVYGSARPDCNLLSFAVLLRHIRSKIAADWDEVMDLLLNVLHRRYREQPVAITYMQELKLWLHLTDVYTADFLQAGAPMLYENSRKPLSTWDQIPPVVCITFQVPRTRLRPEVDHIWGAPCDHEYLGSAFLQGNKCDANYSIEVRDDRDGWAGKSSLVVSFLIPTWILFQEPLLRWVEFGFQGSPPTRQTLEKELGSELILFRETLRGNDRVHITKHMPNMTGLPIFGAGSKMTASVNNSSAVRSAMMANYNPKRHRIDCLTYKIGFSSHEMKQELGVNNLSSIQSKFTSMTAEIAVGETLRYRAEFPMPISTIRSRHWTTRNSLYLGLLAPPVGPLDDDASSGLVFPVEIASEPVPMEVITPVNMNMPYVNLNVLPILDVNTTAGTPKLQWLDKHLSLMFSSRERGILEAVNATVDHNQRMRLAESQNNDLEGKMTCACGEDHNPAQRTSSEPALEPTCDKVRQSGPPIFAQSARKKPITLSRNPQGARIAFKYRLSTLFKSFKMRGGRHGPRIFVIQIPDKELRLVPFVLFLAALKLDLANHTVVIDAAVLPFDESIRDHKVQKFQEAVHVSELACYLGMWDGEVALWKTILSAWAERCRTWKHINTCEKVSAADGIYTDLLCSCGVGHIPEGFMSNLELPYLDYVLQNYATRIAISPCFAVPYVEDCSRPHSESQTQKAPPDRKQQQSENQPASDRTFKLPERPKDQSATSNWKGKELVSRCNHCGCDKNKEIRTQNELFECPHCRVVKYCSKKCFRADKKRHKADCEEIQRAQEMLWPLPPPEE